MKSTKTNGFTLIELIFVIVIIGVLTAVAIPKFQNLTDNAKISSELATAASVQSAIDAAHGDWITSTCSFGWGNGQNTVTASAEFNTTGYPTANEIKDTAGPFSKLLKNAENGDWTLSGGKYYGPASRIDGKGAKAKSPDNPAKPDGNDYWIYSDVNGTFTLINN